MYIRIRRCFLHSILSARLSSTSLFSLVYLVLLCTMLCTLSFAQQYPNSGFPQFSTQTGSAYDSINLADSNISINFPLRSMAAGPMPLSFSLFGQSNAYVLNLYPEPNLWQITTPGLNGFVSSVGANVTTAVSEPTTCNNVADTWYTNFAVKDSYGTFH